MTTVHPSTSRTIAHVSSSPCASVRSKSEKFEQPTKEQVGHDVNVVPQQNTTHTTAAVVGVAPKSSVKVSNINVSDEKLHLSMIALLGCVLAQLVAFEEAQFPHGRGPISMFHTAYVPSISIQSYLKRIALYTKVSTEVLIQSVLHVHQLMQRTQAPLIVNKLNVHRLLLTSIMCTAKFFDDCHYNSAYYSYVGGVPLKELNALEVEFLSLLNFDFYVNSQTYQYFYSMVVERNIHQNGCSCSALLPSLPKSLPVNEYTPDPEVDWNVPCEGSPLYASMCEDMNMEVVESLPSSTITARSTPDSMLSTMSSTMTCTSSRGSQSTTSTVTSASTPTSHAITTIVVVAPSSAMDDMNDELGSIRIEEDPCMNCSATPEAPKGVFHTPKQLTVQQLHVTQHTQQRSASPASFLSASAASTLTESPSSVGSYSQSYPSRMQAHPHSPSVSLSLSHIDGYPHHRFTSVVEESISDYLVATPKQCANGATPLAATMKAEIERKEREMQLDQQAVLFM